MWTSLSCIHKCFHELFLKFFKLFSFQLLVLGARWRSSNGHFWPILYVAHDCSIWVGKVKKQSIVLSQRDLFIFYTWATHFLLPERCSVSLPCTVKCKVKCTSCFLHHTQPLFAAALNAMQELLPAGQNIFHFTSSSDTSYDHDSKTVRGHW